MRLRAATDCTAWVTSLSLTRMPESRARLTCRRISTRRSSTCRSSTSRGGRAPGWSAYWIRMFSTARSSSLRRITSSSTMATMLSTGWVTWAMTGDDSAATVASGTARAREIRCFMRGRPPAPVRAPTGSAGVVKNSIIQQPGRVAAEAADTVQFEFQVDARTEVAGLADVAAGHHPDGHAAALPLDAAQGFQGLVVAQGIVPAADQAPVALDRHDEGQVALFQLPAAVAVGQVDQAALVAEAPLAADGAEGGALVVRVPLVRQAQAPLPGQGDAGLGHPGRAFVAEGIGAGNGHPRRIEIVHAADAGAQQL